MPLSPLATWTLFICVGLPLAIIFTIAINDLIAWLDERRRRGP